MSDIPATNEFKVALVAVAWEIVWEAYSKGEFKDTRRPISEQMTNRFIDVYMALSNAKKMGDQV
jgi:hypothetical protein